MQQHMSLLSHRASRHLRALRYPAVIRNMILQHDVRLWPLCRLVHLRGARLQVPHVRLGEVQVLRDDLGGCQTPARARYLVKTALSS